MRTQGWNQTEQDYSLLMKTPRRPLLKNAGRLAYDAVRVMADRRMPPRASYLYAGSRNFARFSIENGVRNVVLLDKRARPLWVGMAEYWRRAYPREQRPGIHFINPAALQQTVANSKSPAELRARLTDAAGLCARGLARSALRSASAAPTLVADLCAHSGQALYLSKRVLEEVGFDELHTGVITSAVPAKSPLRPSLHVTDNQFAFGCRIGGPGAEITADRTDALHSRPLGDPGRYQAGADVRAYIAAVIEAGWRQEQAMLAYAR
jgi:hypothetical protein